MHFAQLCYAVLSTSNAAHCSFCRNNFLTAYGILQLSFLSKIYDFDGIHVSSLSARSDNNEISFLNGNFECPSKKKQTNFGGFFVKLVLGIIFYFNNSSSQLENRFFFVVGPISLLLHYRYNFRNNHNIECTREENCRFHEKLM